MAYRAAQFSSYQKPIDFKGLVAKGANVNTPYLLYKVHTIPPITATDYSIPVELSLVCFSIAEGVIGTFWTIIHPGQLPMGSGTDVKYLKEMTGLPTNIENYTPNQMNKAKIAEAVAKMIERCTRDYDPEFRGKGIVFCMEDEVDQSMGSLEWLGSVCKDGKLRELLEQTEALDLAYLFLCLAKRVNEMNPAYVSPMLQFELPALARNEIQRFIKYNFCPSISCPFHVNSKEGKNVMDQCTLNCVLRRVFCLLEDLVISSGVKLTKHHVVRETSESPTIVELTSIV